MKPTIITAIAIASIVLLAALNELDKAAMDACEQKHSHSTCFYTLNR